MSWSAYVWTMVAVAGVASAPFVLWWIEAAVRRRRDGRLSPEAREQLRRWSP